MEEVRVDFKCQLCGRRLISLDSIERGYGLKCYNKILDKQQTRLNVFSGSDEE
jgi:DNA-directed RNA polymerase subunit RPC12/RpoP